MVGFWDKVIYSIFSIPLAILGGVILCWLLSFYFQGIKSFSDYLLFVFFAIMFTTALSFFFPTFVAKVLTSMVNL